MVLILKEMFVNIVAPNVPLVLTMKNVTLAQLINIYTKELV